MVGHSQCKHLVEQGNHEQNANMTTSSVRALFMCVLLQERDGMMDQVCVECRLSQMKGEHAFSLSLAAKPLTCMMFKTVSVIVTCQNAAADAREQKDGKRLQRFCDGLRGNVHQNNQWGAVTSTVRHT